MEYLILFITILITSQWVPIRNNILSVFGQKTPYTVEKNKAISRTIKEKTGVKIETFKIIEDHKPHGAMIGIPGKPQLLLSRDLYSSFNKSELEYVLLHEAGHYILKHGIKIALVITILFLSGLYILNTISIKLPIETLVVLIGFVFGIISIQYQRVCEYKADAFTLERMTNPEGMITATYKFKKAWGNWPPQNGLRRKLFYAGVPYSERIKNAQEEIQKRKPR